MQPAYLFIIFVSSCFYQITCTQPLFKRSNDLKSLELDGLTNLFNHTDADLDHLLQSIAGSDDNLYSEFKRIFSDIMTESDLNGGFECNTCLKLAPFFDFVLSNPKLKKDIYVFATTVCIFARIFSARVCVLGVEQWGPIAIYLADEYYLAPKEVCGFLIGSDCVEPVIRPANWTLHFPSTPKPDYVAPTSPPPDVPLAKVLHLTDLHVDLFYGEGNNSQCYDPLCCRSIDGEPISYFYAAAKYGTVAWCDTPLATVEGLLEKLSKETFDWIIVTGDLPAHDTYNQTREDNLRVIKLVNELLRKYFPNTTVLQTIGNHESFPIDLFIPPYVDVNKTANPMSWLYEMLADEWSFWLPNSTLDTIKRGGYWSWEFTPGLKMISLNSGYGQSKDFYSIVNSSDYTGMLQWFIDELQDAEDRGMKTWIMSHHPSFSLSYYQQQFDGIIQRYINVISGWYNGHTHTDSFKVFYDEITVSGSDKRNSCPVPVLTAFTAPSVTTYTDSNMAYRVYYVDALRPNATFLAADYDTFFLNVTKAKETGRVSWELEYNMRKTYNMSDLLPTNFDGLVTQISNESQVATKFLYYYNKSIANQTCDLNCANKIAQELRYTLKRNK